MGYVVSIITNFSASCNWHNYGATRCNIM